MKFDGGFAKKCPKKPDFRRKGWPLSRLMAGGAKGLPKRTKRRLAAKNKRAAGQKFLQFCAPAAASGENRHIYLRQSSGRTGQRVSQCAVPNSPGECSIISQNSRRRFFGNLNEREQHLSMVRVVAKTLWVLSAV